MLVVGPGGLKTIPNKEKYSTSLTSSVFSHLTNPNNQQSQIKDYKNFKFSLNFPCFAEMEGVSTRPGQQEEEDKKKRNRKLMPKLRCFRTEQDDTGSMDITIDSAAVAATHLVIMVNGIIGSAQNWRYSAKQFLKKYPEDVIVHCSECNPAKLTFDGVDVMGGRLVEEVISVIKCYPSVRKISFIGHSLGGVVARYAIAQLYGQDVSNEVSQGNGDCRSNDSEESCLEEKFRGKIAGLEPINFITFATPHLGSRWHKQVPVFGGSDSLEKVVTRMSWCVGRSVKHLFLTDRDNGKPSLLLRMVNDCEDLKFISALQSFKRCVAYANERFDHLVGWGTSSIRRRNELPKRQHLSRCDKYPHIVNVEPAKSPSPHQDVPLEAIANGCNDIDMEEEMIRGLTKVSWERVDVNFGGSKLKYLAHSSIQVKNYCINSDGADVVQHMVDNFVL